MMPMMSQPRRRAPAGRLATPLVLVALACGCMLLLAHSYSTWWRRHAQSGSSRQQLLVHGSLALGSEQQPERWRKRRSSIAAAAGSGASSFGGQLRAGGIGEPSAAAVTAAQSAVTAPPSGLPLQPDDLRQSRSRSRGIAERVVADVCWAAPFLDHSSFGVEARTLVLGLLRHGVVARERLHVSLLQVHRQLDVCVRGPQVCRRTRDVPRSRRLGARRMAGKHTLDACTFVPHVQQ